MTRSWYSISIAVLLVAGSIGAAQTRTYDGQAEAFWEYRVQSSDPWVRAAAVSIPLTTPAIDVRFRYQFTPETAAPPTRRYLGGAWYDAVIREAGAGDMPVMISRETTARWTQTVAPSRFGSTIKIDDSRDTDPAGQGPYNVTSWQSNPSLGDLKDFSNPITLLSFRYNLDGTAGARTFDAIFEGRDRFAAPNSFAFTYLETNSGSVNFAALTWSPMTVMVVPTPGAAVVVVAGMCVLVRSRRVSWGDGK